MVDFVQEGYIFHCRHFNKLRAIGGQFCGQIWDHRLQAIALQDNYLFTCSASTSFTLVSLEAGNGFAISLTIENYVKRNASLHAPHLHSIPPVVSPTNCLCTVIGGKETRTTERCQVAES